MLKQQPLISIIIPVYNEQENIEPLFLKLTQVKLKWPREVIWVNDGSTDRTEEQIRKLTGVTLISLRRNFGQTAALMAGVNRAKGDILVTMDGDGQNDPGDIPSLIGKLNEGYEAVCGWRKERHDPWSKKFIARGAELLRRMILKDPIHDSGCTLKAYQRECFVGLDLFGEMHRFIPEILLWKGYRIAEVPVRHYPRKFGQSKYTLTRIFKSLIDMINVWFWYRYSARPLHLFGGLGLMLIFLGALLLTGLLALRLVYGYGLADKIWPLVGFFSILAGIQLFVSGILADIAIKNYFNTPERRSYTVRSVEKF